MIFCAFCLEYWCTCIPERREPTMATIQFRPTDARVLVRLIDDGDRTSKGGIVLAGARKEEAARAKVLAVGPGARDANGVRHPPGVRDGDVVLVGRHAGYEVVLDGERCSVVQEQDILGVLEA